MSLVNDARLAWSHHGATDALRRLLRTAMAPGRATEPVALDDPRLLLSDCSGHLVRQAGLLRMTRPVRSGTEMEHCAPGARLSFVTTSRRVDLGLQFQRFGRYMSPGSSIGSVLVDGRQHTTFMGRDTGRPQRLVLHLPPGRHQVELVWPYGRGMAVLSLHLMPGASLEAPPPRPAGRLVLVGDSITQGLTSSGIGRSWAFQLTQALGVQAFNLGFASRRAHAEDGAVAAALRPHVAIYMIGVGDFFHQTEMAAYREAVAGFVSGFRRAAPQAALVVVTALHTEVKPRTAQRWSLDDYRATLAAVACDAGATVIEGEQCMRPHRSRLRRDKVHLNDLGAAEMALAMAHVVQPLLDAELERPPAAA